MIALYFYVKLYTNSFAAVNITRMRYFTHMIRIFEYFRKRNFSGLVFPGIETHVPHWRTYLSPQPKTDAHHVTRARGDSTCSHIYTYIYTHSRSHESRNCTILGNRHACALNTRYSKSLLLILPLPLSLSPARALAHNPSALSIPICSRARLFALPRERA